MCFNIEDVRNGLDAAFSGNSEVDLLSTLKGNSFLFYHLYSRKYGIQPNFSEVSFGGGLRCDFCWLNDNSDGPEWVLVEIEKPKLKLFTAGKKPTAEFNGAIEQVRSWSRYFHLNPSEMRRIFGAASKFRYILVAGSKDDWEVSHAAQWRAHFNGHEKIEIRSSNIFYESLQLYIEHEEEFWSFKQNPTSLPSKNLGKYCDEYDYIKKWRSILN
ncbi:Shedu anti-phage system protein SduA domain-containing protein [Chromobacterium haemolyticum]|uniref:Shedu anti-phage system protein SduA domain-containing protein n=1 Tax=Chromobacterium haemolyticum TaxID=394935 RepID=UPI0040553D77